VLTRNSGFYPSPLSVNDVIERVGLGEKADARVKTLSGGQLRRLDLGLGIIGNPEVLLLDEPTTGFDPSARRDAWELVRSLTGQGTTVLLTTHYMDEAERLCDRLAIVDRGQVIAEGSPAELVARLGGDHVVEFAASGNSDDFDWQLLAGVESVRSHEGMVSLNVREPHRTIPTLLDALEQHGSQLLHLTTRQASLEDVFVRLTGRHLRED
jgi:ABC-2 type transport system ATP-binding protein